MLGWLTSIIAYLTNYSGVAAWLALVISISSFFAPSLRTYKKRSMSEKLAALAIEAHQLLNRSVSEPSDYSDWKTVYGDWLSRAYQFVDKNLPRAEGMRLRTMTASKSEFLQAWGDLHRGDLQQLEPRYLRIRDLADELSSSNPHN